MLAFLSSSGLRVPAVYGVFRQNGTWTVRMQLVEGARDLRKALSEGLQPASLTVLARELGHQLGLLHAAHVDHPDLHAGNVLVDISGRAWLIDFQSARRRRLRPALIERDLLRAEAFLRERMPPRMRLRAFIEHQRELARGTGEAPSRISRQLARRLAADAPAARRALVSRGANRWLRESGVMRARPLAGGELLCRRDLRDPDDATRGELANTLRLTGTPATLRTLWLNAARAVEHALPVAQPWQLRIEGARAEALFQLVPGTSGGEGHLRELLRDRGLTAQPFGAIASPMGGILLRPPEQLSAAPEA